MNYNFIDSKRSITFFTFSFFIITYHHSNLHFLFSYIFIKYYNLSKIIITIKNIQISYLIKILKDRFFCQNNLKYKKKFEWLLYLYHSFQVLNGFNKSLFDNNSISTRQW